MKAKKFLCLILAFAAAIGLVSCSGDFARNKTKFSDTYWDAFDTMITLTAYCNDEKEFSKISDEAKELFIYYHKLFDIYNEYDGLNNAATVNKNAGTKPVKVDAALLDLLEFSKRLYDETDGNMNVAFGAVLKKWHEARENANSGRGVKLPDMDVLKECALHCCPDDIVIDRNDGTVYLSDPLMSLDLGAVAKGFATELVAQKLKSDGYDGIIISAGGNTRSIGLKPDEQKWNVAIQNPDKDSNDYAAVLSVGETSVVTSGTYERFFELNGKRYHHIINKDSLMPENNFLSVTITAEDSGLADALSTAVFNMTLDEGREYIENLNGVEAMWILNDQSQIYSTGFEKLLSK